MSDVVVLVSALDTFAACWEPFCHGFKRYWPDCPWPLVFLTNHRDPPCGTAIKIDTTTDWVKMHQEGLSRVGVPVVLFMLEDYWLHKPVDTSALVDFANLVLSGQADYIRLCRQADMYEQTFSAGDFPGDGRLYIFSDEEPYRASLQAAFWRVDVFASLFQEGDDPWTFETKGRGNPKFLCVKECKYIRYTAGVDPDYDFSAMQRGLWTCAAHQYAKKEGLTIDFSRQPAQGL